MKTFTNLRHRRMITRVRIQAVDPRSEVGDESLVYRQDKDPTERCLIIDRCRPTDCSYERADSDLFTHFTRAVSSTSAY